MEYKIFHKAFGIINVNVLSTQQPLHVLVFEIADRVERHSHVKYLIMNYLH